MVLTEVIQLSEITTGVFPSRQSTDSTKKYSINDSHKF